MQKRNELVLIKKVIDFKCSTISTWRKFNHSWKRRAVNKHENGQLNQ